MLNTAEDGESLQLPDGRRRSSEFRVRVWDPMESLRWTPTIIVANVLGNDTADVIDAEEDEAVQGFLPQRPNEPLDVWRGIRSAIRDGDFLDAQDLVKPAVEVTAIAACLSILAILSSPHSGWSPEIRLMKPMCFPEMRGRPILPGHDLRRHMALKPLRCQLSTVLGSQASSFLRSSVNRELLTQGNVLQGQGCPRHQRGL